MEIRIIYVRLARKLPPSYAFNTQVLRNVYAYTRTHCQCMHALSSACITYLNNSLYTVTNVLFVAHKLLQGYVHKIKDALFMCT